MQSHSLLKSICYRWKRWQGRLFGGVFALRPLGQLMSIGPDGLWRSTGRDPRFACVTGRYPLRAGWYSFSIDLEITEGSRLQPMLYFDFGYGMHEAWSLDLNFIRSGSRRHSGVVLLERDVHDMRFDPADMACSFRVGGLSMRPLTRLQAAWRMLHAIRLRHVESGESYSGDLIGESLRRLCRRNGRRAFATWLHGLYTWRREATPSYERWLDLYDRADASQPKTTDMLISILLPTYNTPETWLRRCLDSVLAQAYPNWELCVVDDASTAPHVSKVLLAYSARDARIRIALRQDNGHVSAATNDALKMARGSYVALLDHDDELHPDALATVASALERNPHWQMAYSDEDKIDEAGRRFDPYFKPDWNADLLHGQNCVSHLGIYSRALMESVGGFREGLEGSQDWDLALRCVERLSPDEIGHIPKVLYHWRAIEGSTAKGVDQKSYAHHAGLRALREHFVRMGRQVEVREIEGLQGLFRVRHPMPEKIPLVSIVIPTRDKLSLLRRCVESIFQRTTYPHYEILIVDNQSRERETLDYLSALEQDSRVSVLRHDLPFNYSHINNEAVRHSRGTVVCLLNNDVEVITPDWMEELVSHAMRPHVGAVGAMLYYPDDTIQHAGVIIGVHGVAAHPYSKRPRGHGGQMARARLTQALSAVTAACLMVRREIFEQVGGLDVDLPVAFNDVDFCLRIRRCGYTNIWTPFAELYHHESASRGHEDTAEKHQRFEREIDFMMKRWSPQLRADPYYNPNLSLCDDPFSLAFPPRDWSAASLKPSTVSHEYVSPTWPQLVSQE